MRVGGTPYRSIFLDEDAWGVRVVDQTVLPHRFQLLRLESADDVVRAIRSMVVRGAPLMPGRALHVPGLRVDRSIAMPRIGYHDVRRRRRVLPGLRHVHRRRRPRRDVEQRDGPVQHLRVTVPCHGDRRRGCGA